MRFVQLPTHEKVFDASGNARIKEIDYTVSLDFVNVEFFPESLTIPGLIKMVKGIDNKHKPSLCGSLIYWANICIATPYEFEEACKKAIQFNAAFVDMINKESAQEIRNEMEDMNHDLSCQIKKLKDSLSEINPNF